jgi:TrmH family RNA methyltransferase
VAGLVQLKEFSLDDVVARKAAGPLVVVAGLQDPGNLGTILRSAEAFGTGGVILGEGTVHYLNSKVVRASAGSVFRLPITTTKLSEAIQAMRQNKVRMLATSSHKGIPLRDANLGAPLAIFIGSEGAGVSRDLVRDMDDFIAIPHSPQVESLNAGVAASIVLYEAARQK